MKTLLWQQCLCNSVLVITVRLTNDRGYYLSLNRSIWWGTVWKSGPWGLCGERKQEEERGPELGRAVTGELGELCGMSEHTVTLMETVRKVTLTKCLFSGVKPVLPGFRWSIPARKFPPHSPPAYPCGETTAGWQLPYQSELCAIAKVWTKPRPHTPHNYSRNE